MQNQWSYLLPFFKAHRWQILLSLCLGGIASLFALLVPISVGKFFSYLWAYDSFRAQILTILPHAWTKDLDRYLIFFSSLVLLQGLTMYGERWYVARLGERLSLYLREQLFAAQLQTPLSLVESRGIGRYLLRWSGDLKSIKRLFTHGMLRFSRDIMLLLGACGFLIAFFPEILVPVLGVLCLCWLSIMFLRPRLKRATVEQRNRQSSLLAFVSRRLRALATIQALNRDVPEAKRFAKRSQRYYQSVMRYHQHYHLLFSFAKLSVYLVLLVLMWWAMRQVQAGKAFSEGEKILSAFLLLISLRSLLGRLLRVPIYWELGMISLNKLTDIINFAEVGEKEPYAYENGDLRLKGLQFQAREWEPGLKISKLEVSGKQTIFLHKQEIEAAHYLFPILMGLYSGTAKQLGWDGQVISELEPKSLRRKICLASDRLPLLGRTVFEAISYSRNPKKKAKAAQLLAEYQVHLPKQQRLQLGMQIGELGAQLSPKESYLLLALRAILSNKPILLWEIDFRNFEPLVRLQLVSWLNAQRGKKTVLILGDMAPSGLQLDQFYPAIYA